MPKITVSEHAKKRMKQRCGLNKRSIERIAQKAFDEGIKHSETTGRINKWITKKYFYNETANNIRIYGDKMYLFSDYILITVLQIPNSLLRDLPYMVRKEMDFRK